MRSNSNHRKQSKNKSNNIVIRTEYIILFLIVVFFSLGFVRLKAEQLRVGYEISSNSKLEQQLLQKKQNLKAEYMQLKSPERLEYLANNLGFKFPTQDDVIFVEKATVVGNRK